MNRRDFLLLRSERHESEVELSCQRLYMRWLDSQASGAEDRGSDNPTETSLWGGEPPARLGLRTPAQLFEQLDRELRLVDALRVVDAHWLVEEMRPDFERLIATFRARGGRVTS